MTMTKPKAPSTELANNDPSEPTDEPPPDVCPDAGDCTPDVITSGVAPDP